MFLARLRKKTHVIGDLAKPMGGIELAGGMIIVGHTVALAHVPVQANGADVCQ